MDLHLEHISIDIDKINRPVKLDCLPVLPSRNLVLFPGVNISVALLREESLAAAEYCEKHNSAIGVFCQKEPEEDFPSSIRDIYKYGVAAIVLKIIELPDGSKTALLLGRQAIHITRKAAKGPKDIFCVAADNLSDDYDNIDNETEFKVCINRIFDMLEEFASLRPDTPGETLKMLRENNEPVISLNSILTNFPFKIKDKIKLLATPSPKKRAMHFIDILSEKLLEADLLKKLMMRTKTELEEGQKRAFMQQQLEVLQNELYGEDGDVEKMALRIEDAVLPDNVREVALKELSRLRRYNPQTPDYSVIYTYLDTLLSLPWNVETELNTDFALARQALDSEHCSLDKVKERILEQLAVLINNPDGKAPILCLVGPPGVGKTSLGESIARALGRQYQRVALGGLHDESEIRGHRRTYIGAMPGRIIDAIKRAGTRNPVVVLDEIDKIGADYKGDPSAAMLEVLDPEQNAHFHDNYIDVDFDLSHVLFIATANSLDTLPPPLLDRLEVVNLSGYITEEKIEIARTHLIRRNATELGISPDAFAISDAAITDIIDLYTAESGVRQLQKALAKIARRHILATMEGKTFPTTVEPEHLQDLLGTPPYSKDRYEGNDIPGVVTGLAWTRAGGETLLVETSLSPGKGNQLSLTGNLGDVMKESATIALKWVKTHSAELGINPEIFDKNDINIHFPEGAVPKDGPSAGITIATALVSLLTSRKLRPRTAMTGEITLRGKVLAVGGIKEKILSAKRSGITDIIICPDNRKDIDDIPERYTRGLTFHYAATVAEVISIALPQS